MRKERQTLMRFHTMFWIEGGWKPGDPEEILKKIYTDVNQAKITTVYVQPCGENGLDAERMPDPYALFESGRDYKKVLRMVRERLAEDGYTIQNEEDDSME